MVDLIHRLTNLLFFDIPLLYCYTNLNSSTICLSSGDMCLLFGTSVLLFCNLFGDFFECNFVETLVILSPICYQLNHQLPLLFWIAFFEAVFIASIADFFALSRSFQLFTQVFSKRQKFISFFIHSFSRFNWMPHFCYRYFI